MFVTLELAWDAICSAFFAVLSITRKRLYEGNSQVFADTPQVGRRPDATNQPRHF